MKRWTLLIVIALLALSLACSFGKSKPVANPTPEATMENPASGGNGGSQATAEPSNGGQSEENGGEETMPDFSTADLGGLNSYRATLTYRTEYEDGTIEEGSIFVEETRDPQAYHMIITDNSEDGGTMEMISIGQDQWINIDGEWMYSQVPPEEIEPFGGALILDPEEIFTEVSKEDYEYVGKEKINGIQTKHYHFELDPADAAEMGDMSEAEEGTADIWIANESDLPEFPVKMLIVTKGKMDDGTIATTTIEMEITDVNAPIKIEPPADAAAGLPGDLPEYPNATDVAMLGDIYSFHTDDDVATVQSFYEEALNDAGWEKTESTEMEGMVMQTWTKGDESIMVMISADEEGGSSVILSKGE